MSTQTVLLSTVIYIHLHHPIITHNQFNAAPHTGHYISPHTVIVTDADNNTQTKEMITTRIDRYGIQT